MTNNHHNPCKHSTNRLPRWALLTALVLFPTWAFAQSDLIMTAASSTTAAINTKGGTISIANTIKNQGTTASTVNVRIGLYLSTDNVITTADTLLGSRTVPALTASATNNGGVNLTVPANLAPGTYYLGAIADDTGLETESDETNNALTGTTLTVTQSDLVMTAVASTTPQVNTKGGYINVSDTLTNQGPVASTVSVRVGYYLSTDNVITTADTFLGYRSVVTLAAGASTTNAGYTYYANVPAGLAPGTYYLGAIADYSGLEAETDETNNGLVSATSTLEVTFPDLVMTAVASTTPQVNTKGGYINVSDTLTNQGSVASTASVRVGYYLSTDNVITSTDTFLGYRSVYTVAAGASNTNAGYGYYANVPAGLAPGTYYLGAIADYSGLEAETDETNNGLVSATSTLEVTLPDLVMTAVGSTTSQINTAGGPIYVSDTLKNQGPVASTVGVRVGYYLSTDDVITTADTFLGYRTSYSTLAAGASNSVTSTYVTVPAGLTVGSTYYLGAIADYTGLEAETDETNNALAGEGATITVTQPDLVMTAVGSTTSQVNTAGGYIYVSDTLKNQGAVASTVSVRVGYYLSTDNIITTADTFLGYRTASTVAAGASNSVASSYVTIPAGLTVGSTYYLGAIVDYTGLEAETDETNNALAGVGSTITVTQPDLVMTAVGSTATQAAPGGLINVSDTLTNQGPVASTAGVRVGYYLSTDNVITTADTFLGYRSVGTLAAGANSTNSGANYATIPAATAVGTYYLGAIADYSGLQAETDETNNALVGPTIAIGPDLIMTGVSSASTTAVPGSGILIADTLKNQGAGATGSGCRQIGYYLSTDATITGADTLIGSREYCGALAANGSNNGAATSATIPANLAAGSYYLGAIADHTGVDAETDETNNSLSGSTLLLTLLPNAPGNVTASGGNASATVTFTAPVDNGGSAITGYTVTASPAGGVDSNAGTPGLSHVITGLANGTAYTFTVIATNNAGNSNASAASNSVTPATVPGAPVIGSAVANNAQASVTFSAPADNGGAIITGYTVSSLPAGGVDNNAGTTGLNHIITGLTNGTAYTFTVKASNSAGNSAASAASNSVTPSISAPNAPTNVIAAGGNTQASVGFSAPTNDGGSAITGYTVSSNPAGLVDSNAGTTSLTHLMTGLVGGTTYTFTVTATNAAGSSAPSVPSNSVTAGGSAVQAYYVYTDHLDTPRQITDTSGNIVWQWDSSDPFGNNVPNENPTGQGTFTCNLRHPGQYFDIETGLFQNFHRDYDSATGRYIQSDPIGLRGGINGYTYVENNPLSKIDPTGEFAFILPALPAIGSWIAANAANIGIGVGLGVLMSTPGDTADSPEKKADRNAYHKVCDEPPPPNLNECDDIRWKIGRANRCIGMRKAYMSKWNDEYEGHYNQIANRESELARLERLLKEKCCGK